MSTAADFSVTLTSGAHASHVGGSERLSCGAAVPAMH
jgi:hypothetical protein